MDFRRAYLTVLLHRLKYSGNLLKAAEDFQDNRVGYDQGLIGIDLPDGWSSEAAPNAGHTAFLQMVCANFL